MYVKEVLVQNKAGLHARPATFFIQKANEYKSTVWVEKEERRVNAKSLLGVLSLGIIGDTTIKIIADGPDEQAAVDNMRKAFNGMRTDEAVENVLNMFAHTKGNKEFVNLVKKNRILWINLKILFFLNKNV